MEVNRRLRLSLRLQGGLFLVLLVILIALLALIAADNRKEWDITRGARNTLSPATLDVLRRLDGTVRVTGYAVTRDAGGRNLHELLQERLRPYQRVKPEIALTLVDPREQPQRAAAAGLRSPNELVIEYRKRTEHLPLADFSERSFVNALMRLMRTADNLVMWLDGHGERKLDGIANHDLGDFGRQLIQRGLRLNSLNLALAQEVPDNAALLVIASPQVNLAADEVQKIMRYVRRGGSLLWLIDPEPLRGLQPLAEFLGLVLTPGTVVDPALKPRSGPPAFATAASYARHPITGTFRLNTLFPFARYIGTSESEEWRVTPLIEVAPRGWVEVGKLDDGVTFDKARDLPGPVNIAAALERTVNDRQQRVVVVGTGQFLANSFLGNGGNLQLGLGMINWLAGDDDMVTIESRPAADSQINLEPMTLYLIAFSFLLVLPLAFVVTGSIVWWRRRRAL